jgi:hypothetical protein
MLTGPMPKITPAPIVSVVTFAVSQAVAWGWVNNDAGQRLISAGGTLIALVLPIVEAYLRGERAKAVASNPSMNHPVVVPPAPPVPGI